MPTQLDDIQKRNNARTSIEKFERDFRLFIEEELKNCYDDNWWESGVPQTVRIRISNQINNIKKQEPKRIIKKREQFTFNDYKDIVLYRKNWVNVFENIFQEKTNISYPLNKLRLIRNHLNHARELNDKDINKIETYFDDIFNFVPTEFTKEDLPVLNEESLDPTEQYINHWKEKIKKTIENSIIPAVPEGSTIRNFSDDASSNPNQTQTTLSLITTDRIISVLSSEWQTIKHLIFKLKIKDMMDARYLQLKLKELERKEQVQVEVKMGRKHWKLKRLIM